MDRKKKIALVVFAVFAAVFAFAMGKYNYAAVSFVSGTEYQMGEQGSTIISVTNAFGDPVTVDWCNETIYYPNGTVWVSNQPMTQTGSAGSYYYYFTTPSVLGNYQQYIECQVHLISGTRIIKARKAFHVSQAETLANETASAIINILT